jgi:type I restriction-modification system DNA methylase subunit
LNNIITNIGRNAGFFAQPKEMTELVAEIISPKCKDIFNPFSGLMSYALGLNIFKKFDAIEFDRETWNMGRIRVALADKNDKVNSKLEDMDNWPNEKYDAIVSTPPIGILNTFENRKELFKWEFSKIIPLLRFGTSTTDIGELYTYVSLRVLDSEAEKNIRVRIAENNWLEAVILMPSGLLNTTNVSTALVILKKDRDINSPIKMINATTLYHQNGKNRILNVEAIVEA